MKLSNAECGLIASFYILNINAIFAKKNVYVGVESELPTFLNRFFFAFSNMYIHI